VKIRKRIRKALEAWGLKKPKQTDEGAPLGYDFEEDARALIPIVRKYTMTNLPRLITLYQQVRYCEEACIPGALVECGVWKGGAVGLMALANLKLSTARRDLHLFDAFTEICEPDEAVDGARAVQEARAWSRNGGTQGRLRPLTGVYDAFGGPGTLEENRNLLENIISYNPDRIQYHEGWFQETLPAKASTIGPIALLRLDGDLYASTKVCLEHLYDQVVPGGVVIIDDYGAYEGCRKAVDEFIATRGLKIFLSHVDTDCRYWIKH